jgi:hypothetical protein
MKLNSKIYSYVTCFYLSILLILLSGCGGGNSGNQSPASSENIRDLTINIPAQPIVEKSINQIASVAGKINLIAFKVTLLPETPTGGVSELSVYVSETRCSTIGSNCMVDISVMMNNSKQPDGKYRQSDGSLFFRHTGVIDLFDINRSALIRSEFVKGCNPEPRADEYNAYGDDAFSKCQYRVIFKNINLNRATQFDVDTANVFNLRAKFSRYESFDTMWESDAIKIKIEPSAVASEGLPILDVNALTLKLNGKITEWTNKGYTKAADWLKIWMKLGNSYGAYPITLELRSEMGAQISALDNEFRTALHNNSFAKLAVTPGAIENIGVKYRAITNSTYSPLRPWNYSELTWAFGGFRFVLAADVTVAQDQQGQCFKVSFANYKVKVVDNYNFEYDQNFVADGFGWDEKLYRFEATDRAKAFVTASEWVAVRDLDASTATDKYVSRSSNSTCIFQAPTSPIVQPPIVQPPVANAAPTFSSPSLAGSVLLGGKVYFGGSVQDDVQITEIKMLVNNIVAFTEVVNAPSRNLANYYFDSANASYAGRVGSYVVELIAKDSNGLTTSFKPTIQVNR